ncbi:MAG TPA: Flp family type IVb pilin [Acidobacteriaceae bacterium]|nr:Flp family type IVb pilin [Acidobacteriaceae bacterium]
MERISEVLAAFARSESGGNLIEYALLAALVAIACVSTLETFGKKDLLKTFTTVGTDFKKAVK